MIAEGWWLTRSGGLAKRLMKVRKEQESGPETPLSTLQECMAVNDLTIPN